VISGPRTAPWLSFLQDLVARGLRDPLLLVMDGAPGLVKAIKRVCLAHISSGVWRTTCETSWRNCRG